MWPVFSGSPNTLFLEDWYKRYSLSKHNHMAYQCKENKMIKIYKIAIIVMAHISFFARGMEEAQENLSCKRKREEETVQDGLSERQNKVYGATSALLDAVSRGDMLQANKALIKGADVNHNAHDSQQGSPLFLALYEGHMECAYYLIEKGARITDQDVGELVLTGNVQELLRFIEYGADFKFNAKMALNIVDCFYDTRKEDETAEGKAHAEMLLWLVLRLPGIAQLVKEESELWAKKTSVWHIFFLDQPIYLEDGKRRVSVKERLTPLLVELIFGDPS